MTMRIILVTVMTFRMNFTEESFWVTNNFSSRQLYVFNYCQDIKQNTRTTKDTTRASIVGDKHKPDSIGITWIRMLPDNLYNFISVRPPSFIFELFCGPNSSYWALAAGIFNRQNIPKCFKIFFWPHALKLHCNFVLCNNYRVILLGKTIFLLSTESNIGTSWYCGCEMYDWLGL